MMEEANKIRPFRQLAREIRELKREGQHIALVHCTFNDPERIDRDLFASLRASSDVVVVTVPNARVLRGNSIEARPEQERLDSAARLQDVTTVVPVPWMTAGRAIEEFAPHFFAFTRQGLNDSDPGGPTQDELEALAKVGSELFTLSRRGDAVLEWRQRIPPSTRERNVFTRELRETLTFSDVNEAVDSMRGLRVAVVGETIIDEYAYCDAIGKSGKEPMLVNRFLSCESQAGGVLAIANHLADFCKKVEVVSALGQEDTREAFIESSLREEVRCSFIRKSNSPTITKRRYVDAYTGAKMMGVYNMNTTPLSAAQESRFCRMLSPILKRVDLVIVADYGHGLITDGVVDLLAREAPFLAVNAQVNAANTGYHTLSKYPRADYACMHQGELRMDARDLHGDLSSIIEATADRMKARSMMVTQGKKGTILYRPGEGHFECPALATAVVERIGAGDAVLGLTALAALLDLPPAMTGLLGNLAGAQAVAVVGNRASIRKSRLLDSIKHMLGTSTQIERAAE